MYFLVEIREKDGLWISREAHVSHSLKFQGNFSEYADFDIVGSLALHDVVCCWIMLPWRDRYSSSTDQEWVLSSSLITRRAESLVHHQCGHLLTGIVAKSTHVPICAEASFCSSAKEMPVVDNTRLRSSRECCYSWCVEMVAAVTLRISWLFL